jgi:hypothetical protein
LIKLKNFATHEFVPKSTYIARGEKAIELMDRELLIFIDKLREALDKPITINNWKWGGTFSFRGLRTEESEFYSRYSQHSYGKALDFDVQGMSGEEVRQWIIKNRELAWVKPITFIEDAVNWVHVDTRPTENDGLIVWNPKTGAVKTHSRE